LVKAPYYSQYALDLQSAEKFGTSHVIKGRSNVFQMLFQQQRKRDILFQLEILLHFVWNMCRGMAPLAFLVSDLIEVFYSLPRDWLDSLSTIRHRATMRLWCKFSI